MKKYIKFKGLYIYATPEEVKEIKQRYSEENGSCEEQEEIELVEKICDELNIGLIFNSNLKPKLK